MPAINIPAINLVMMGPQLVVIGLTLAVIIVDLVIPPRLSVILTGLMLAGLAGAIGVCLAMVGGSGETFSGLFRVNSFTLFLQIVFLAAAFLAVLLSPGYIEAKRMPLGEYYAILALSTLGMMVVASAGDLITIFVGIELMSIGIYVLTGFARHDTAASEAALKYFLLGIFATAMLVYGMAWVYGLTGSTSFEGISTALAAMKTTSPILIIAMLMVIAGLAFKIAAVPFHMWTPDAYEGAPTPVTAFMSVAPKAAGFAAVLLIVLGALGPLQAYWTPVMVAMAVMTMFLGNVVALSQTSVKRMLAYSSIAHTGYILVGVASLSGAHDLAVQGILYYSLIYTFMNIGAFGVVVWMERHGSGPRLDNFAGLSAMAPGHAALMMFFMLSLTGIPISAGFLAKYYVFMSAIQADLTWLAVVAALNSAISAVYYLRVVIYMYVKEPVVAVASPRTGLLTAALVISALALLAYFVDPTPILNLARDAIGFI